MLPVFSPSPGQSLALTQLLAVALNASAQSVTARRDSQQLKQFRDESEAFNRQDPFANAYRAGNHNGYLAGVFDTLQGRSVCFAACACDIDKLVGQQLADHPELLDRPVVEWLLPLLEARYPCRRGLPGTSSQAERR